MKHDLIKHLEYLKNLEPDNDFVLSSRRLITSLEQPSGRASFFMLFRPAFAGALAVLVFIVAGAYFIGSRSGSTTASSLNQTKLAKELQDMAISIQVEEITYRQSVDEEVASALEEISNDKVRHLNSGIIKGEADDLEMESGSKTKIDSLLDTVIL